MDNEIFKYNNGDEVKGNATKLECTNYGKNLKCCPSFIQKCLIQNQIIHNYQITIIIIRGTEEVTLVVINNFNLVENKRKLKQIHNSVLVSQIDLVV